MEYYPRNTGRGTSDDRSDDILAVCDVLGRKVRVPLNDNKEAGYHEVRLDNSYLLQARDFVRARKMVVVKQEYPTRDVPIPPYEGSRRPDRRPPAVAVGGRHICRFPAGLARKDEFRWGS